MWAKSELPRAGTSTLRPWGFIKFAEFFSIAAFKRCLRLENWDVPVLSIKKLLGYRTSEKHVVLFAIYFFKRSTVWTKNDYSSSSYGMLSYVVVLGQMFLTSFLSLWRFLKLDVIPAEDNTGLKTFLVGYFYWNTSSILLCTFSKNFWLVGEFTVVIDETTGQQIGLSSTLNMSNLVGGLDYSFIFEIVREYLSLELS